MYLFYYIYCKFKYCKELRFSICISIKFRIYFYNSDQNDLKHFLIKCYSNTNDEKILKLILTNT